MPGSTFPLNRCCCSALLFVLIVGSSTSNAAHKFKVKFSWKELVFDWPSDAARAGAIEKGQYVPQNNLPMGLERWHDKIFVTVPRYEKGIASSLNYIDLNSQDETPKLHPYPSWETNFLSVDTLQQSANSEGIDGCAATNNKFELGNNATVLSALRLQVDACDRLWVIDTGRLDDKVRLAPNSIIIFDLKTDQLLRRFEIPKQQIKEDTSLVNIVVESDAANCADAYAYVADINAYALIVYSYREHHSYRVKHNFFHFDPLEGDFNVDGMRFQWDSGIIGLAVGPTAPDATKDIYFHALSSFKEYKVSNHVLHNESYVTSTHAYDDFHYLGTRGDRGQSTTEVYDGHTNVLYHTLVNQNAIGCWNVGKPYNKDAVGVIESNAKTLSYPNDIKLDAEGNIWVLANRLPAADFGAMDASRENYVITVGKSEELIRNTPCAL